MKSRTTVRALLVSTVSLCAWGFAPDESPQPPRHPPLQPADGAQVATNPPSMVWRMDSRAASYTLEMARNPDFAGDVVRVEGIDLPLYNHNRTLAEGTWFWRYHVVNAAGEVSDPSGVRSFVVPPDAPAMPVPAIAELIANLPDHPRIFVTPSTLDEFRARRDGAGAEAWADIRHAAEQALGVALPTLELAPMPEEPGNAQRQLFYLRDGVPMVATNYQNRDFIAAGTRANTLSLAWLISGDERYAEAARRWAFLNAPFRVDYHLENRANHDTTVYHYEYGLKGIALAYDRLYHRLDETERREILGHILYHADNAMRWVRDRVQLHVNYQNSHAQQCMHPLLVTVLAVAEETEETVEWTNWLVRQYVNRDAWGADDGGYSEGQTYGHKFKDIIEALAALRTATHIDVFQRPRLKNAGRFWMYCMSLNYWWNHWGDVYSLFMAVPGASGDTYIAGFLGAMTEDPYVMWWSDTVLGNPRHLPLWYASATGIEPKPPVDIAQARLFPDTGQLAAYDRFYDHRSNRIFFRASPFGSHSHAHADQNGFVIHAGGEIMAVDAGYYTYYGDQYHYGFSKATQAHNSILVDGKGQPHRNIDAKGRFTAFLDSAEYTVFTGAAEEAYAGMLDRFDRTVVFLRPDLFIVHDDLKAGEPAAFDWVLNAHEEIAVEPEARTLVVRQMDQRLRVRHVFPESLSYAQTNERPFPVLTRQWSRITDAFPQSYHLRATTERHADMRILAVMDAYDANRGPTVAGVEPLAAVGGLAVGVGRQGIVETVLFRDAAATGVSAAGIETDARAASVGRAAGGEPVRWMILGGSRLVIDGVEVFRSDAPCDAAAQLPSPGAAALVQVKPSRPTTAAIPVLAAARTLRAGPPNAPEPAAPVRATGGGIVEIAAETVFLADPVADATAAASLPLHVTDGAGEYTLPLQRSVAANGEIVAWGHFVDPREPGVYEFTATGGEATILVQDRWEMPLNAEGAGTVTATWREAAELFVRHAPDQTPVLRATLRRSYRGELVNLLRNGGFEEGSPGYPPRTWTIAHPRRMGYTWPHWTQEDAVEGRSALKFVRPEINMTLTSQPMRLRRAGTYELRFQARGNATHATVSVSGVQGTSASIPVVPSEEWREYRTSLEVVPGYTVVRVFFGSGGDADQVLWLDDVQFGYLAE